MKRRSPTTVLMLGLFTLSVYDLFWFAITSKELALKTGLRLKSTLWLIVVGMARVAAIIAIIWLLFSVWNAQPPTQVQQYCTQQKTLSYSAQTAKMDPLSPECQQAFHDQAVRDHQQLLFRVLIAVLFVAGFANFVLFTKWLIPYVKAAEVATGGKVNASNSMFALLMREPYGISLLQQAYNNPASIPDILSKDPIVPLQQAVHKPENPKLKLALSVIAGAMIFGLVLFITFIFLVTHL